MKHKSYAEMMGLTKPQEVDERHVAWLRNILETESGVNFFRYFLARLNPLSEISENRYINGQQSVALRLIKLVNEAAPKLLPEILKGEVEK